MDTKYWILLGALTVTFGIIKWIADVIGKKILEKFEEVIASIQDLTHQIIRHTEQLKHSEERMTGLSARVHVLEEDVKDLQINRAQDAPKTTKKRA